MANFEDYLGTRAKLSDQANRSASDLATADMSGVQQTFDTNVAASAKPYDPVKSGFTGGSNDSLSAALDKMNRERFSESKAQMKSQSELGAVGRQADRTNKASQAFAQARKLELAAYEREQKRAADRRAARAGAISSVLGLAGAGVGAIFGGPAGAGIGMGVGSSIGGMFGGK